MLFKSLSAKTTEFLILSVVTLMYIAMCAEADIYVPAFPQMVEYFSTTEDKIQLILSINFIGLCIAGLVTGPLSDAFGRRKVLLSGLFCFAASSVGCVLASDFNNMLLWRLLQGMAASVPMVVGLAVFLDRFSLEKASRMVGLLNTVITGGMAAAPILGSYLANQYGWRLNFVVMMILAILSFLGTYLFIEETLPEEKRSPIKIKQILQNYCKLLGSFKFLGYCVISLLPLVGLVVYISNLSLIFINHLKISPEVYGYYQASTMVAFFSFSYLSNYMIKNKGMEYTKNSGSVILIIGTVLLLVTALCMPESCFWICISMGLFAAGGALILGIFGMRSLDLFPEIKGTAASLNTAIRQLLAAGLVILSEKLFDGTIVPVAIIVCTYVFMASVWYFWLQNNEGLVTKKYNTNPV